MTFLIACLDWLRNNTLGLTEVFRQILILGPSFGWFVLTEDQHDKAMSALSAILVLIISKTNVAAHKVEARKNEAFDKGVAAGVAAERSGTGDGRG